MVKLKASTVVETLIAVLIISLCFTIALTAMIRVFGTQKYTHVIQASVIISTEFDNVGEYNGNNKSETKEVQGYTVITKMSDYERIGNVKLIVVEVFLDDKSILKRKRLYAI